MKVNRHGQATVFSQQDLTRIRRCIKNSQHRLLFDIARYTGERIGAIRQLRVNDVYDDRGRARSEITFRAQTRKGDRRGHRKTRQCPTHPELREILEHTDHEEWGPLFPGDNGYLSAQAVDSFLRRAIAKAGLSHKGFSTHSFRRTLITRLSERGVDLRTIQQITGHQDLKSLQRYIEADPKRAARAIALI